MNAPARATLPTLLVGGYLGAGKTTRINRWLRHAARPGGPRLAVLVNDFGDLPIDADLIEARDGALLSLSGGCLCCSFGDDLVGSLNALAARDDVPRIVLIETSGVALPAAVARTARLALPVQWLGSLVLLDAPALREQLADRYVGETVREQIRQADALWPAKLDRPDAPGRAQLQALVVQAGARVPLQSDDMADDMADDWLEKALAAGGLVKQRAMPAPARADATESMRWAARPVGRHGTTAVGLDHPFESHRLRALDGQTPQALADALRAAGAQIARVKCLGRDANGQGWLLQLAGGVIETRPARFDGPPRGVVISLREARLRERLAPWL